MRRAWSCVTNVLTVNMMNAWEKWACLNANVKLVKRKCSTINLRCEINPLKADENRPYIDMKS